MLDKLPAKANLRPIEVARYFDVSTTLIYDMIKSGEIPAFRFGNHYRIPRDELEAAMKGGLIFRPEI